ncbi:DUF2839 domain-containing protein [Candidatus Atelocyanobacterium thalassae]|uniref:Uncharacterized protein n=1 Tax=cyanobacterium endosymbiont of Braarudosphaera bigelowii TaxID=1285375 RepID=A0ABM7U4U2_9CHRO|nr:DUF2839 domain-containing protein [Candidatus Atelocyanobacterium thalassa]BDA39624.1 hypothetical protein CPARK_000046300 [cyanobacterium endosymbiont of Braarudosphaera bigelowii]
MSESKRRIKKMNNFGKNEERIFPQFPVSKNQANLLHKWTTNAAWIGIGITIFIWFGVHFIGPTFGWWTIKIN